MEHAMIRIRNDNYPHGGYIIRLLRDYECQPFGKKGVLATLQEANEFHKRTLPTLEAFDFTVALHKAWSSHHSGVPRIPDEEDLADLEGLEIWWRYDVVLPSRGENIVRVFRDDGFDIQHLLTVPLAKVKDFALLADY